MHIAIKYIELCVLLVTSTIDHASFSLLVINMRAFFTSLKIFTENCQHRIEIKLHESSAGPLFVFLLR